MITVVNQQSFNPSGKKLVYIGRPSIWGNPFRIGDEYDGDREQVIRKYEQYFEEAGDSFDDELMKLVSLAKKGDLYLVCHCAPLPCHGDFLKAKIEHETEQAADNPGRRVKIVKGNIFNSNADAIVNTVNCVGVMGKGLALNFKQRYPEMYQFYREVCQSGQLRPGMILPYSKLSEGEPLILNFAVKDDWRDPSKYEWVDECMKRFVDNYESLGITSVAFPWIGAMNGQLDLKRVREIMLSYLEPLPITVEIYDYDATVPVRRQAEGVRCLLQSSRTPQPKRLTVKARKKISCEHKEFFEYQGIKLNIGITGHRDYEDRANIAKWMSEVAKQYPEATVVTGGALGTDLIAAEEAEAAGLKSRVILPMLFDVFTKKWNRESKARLQRVLDNAKVTIISVENAKEKFAKDSEAYLGFLAEYESEFLFERNQAIVDECTVLVAFWDGRQSGGTFDTVKKALRADLETWNGLSRRRLVSDQPFSECFRVEEACIEGWEDLQERVGGWQHFGQEAVLCDYECNGGVVYERHEVIGDDEPELAVEARVYASCLCFPHEAKQVAAEIMDFGLEYESYWRGRLKVDFDDAWKELSRLAWGLAEVAPSPLDALEHEWKQSYNDDPSEDTEDVVVDPTHGWHRVGDGRDFVDAELPLPSEVTLHSEGAQALFKRMSETESIRSFGKELYETQKAGKIRMPNSEWTWLWNEYKAARDGYKSGGNCSLMSSPSNILGEKPHKVKLLSIKS